MADSKISALTTLAQADLDAAADFVPIVDTGVTTTKKITPDDLVLGALDQAGIFTKYTNSLGADVNLSNTAAYFDGPSVAQGTTGVFLAMGSLTLTDTAGASEFQVKLHDGTTVIASGSVQCRTGLAPVTVGLSGYITSPAGNIRMSAKDTTATTGKILFNQSGNSKDSTVTAIRIA